MAMAAAFGVVEPARPTVQLVLRRRVTHIMDGGGVGSGDGRTNADGLAGWGCKGERRCSGGANCSSSSGGQKRVSFSLLFFFLP